MQLPQKTACVLVWLHPILSPCGYKLVRFLLSGGLLLVWLWNLQKGASWKCSYSLQTDSWCHVACLWPVIRMKQRNSNKSAVKQCFKFGVGGGGFSLNIKHTLVFSGWIKLTFALIIRCLEGKLAVALISSSCLRRLVVFYLLCRAALQVCGTLPRRPLRAAGQPMRLSAMCPRQGVYTQGSRLHVQLLAGQRRHTVNTNRHILFIHFFFFFNQ